MGYNSVADITGVSSFVSKTLLAPKIAKSREINSAKMWPYSSSR